MVIFRRLYCLIHNNSRLINFTRVNSTFRVGFRRYVTKNENFYEILGVKRDASMSEIKSAYYKLSKQYHPDTQINTEEAQICLKKFHAVSNAYETLGNKEKRIQYDRHLLGRSDTYNNRRQTFSDDEPGDDEVYQDLKRYDDIRRTYRRKGKPDFRANEDFDAYYRHVKQKYDQMKREYEERMKDAEAAEPLEFKEYGRPMENLTEFQKQILRRQQMEFEKGLERTVRIVLILIAGLVLIAIFV